MNVTVVHPYIAGEDFNYGRGHIVREFDGLEAAGNYLTTQVQPKVVPIQGRQLAAYKERASKAGELGTLADHYLEMAKPGFGQPQALALPGIAWPWSVNFYEDMNFGGDSFSLGVIEKISPLVALNPAILGTCDWDTDLRNRSRSHGQNWNDCISSVSCNAYAKYWALCEDINFRGRILFGSGDVADLRAVQPNFNDITSSIVMNSTPVALIQAAVAILIQAVAA